VSNRSPRKVAPVLVEHPVPFGTTLLVKDRCLCLHLQRAARAMARRFDLALKPTGLTNGQFSMLMSLNRPDGPEVPLATMGSVADLLGMDRTTVTAAAQVLCRRNLLKFDVHPTDRRNKVLKLTSEGMRVLAEAVPIWTREHTRLEREMAAGVPERLRGDLQLVARESPDDSPGLPTRENSANYHGPFRGTLQRERGSEDDRPNGVIGHVGGSDG